jgi:hypothetical protein
MGTSRSLGAWEALQWLHRYPQRDVTATCVETGAVRIEWESSWNRRLTPGVARSICINAGEGIGGMNEDRTYTFRNRTIHSDAIALNNRRTAGMNE